MVGIEWFDGDAMRGDGNFGDSANTSRIRQPCETGEDAAGETSG